MAHTQVVLGAKDGKSHLPVPFWRRLLVHLRSLLSLLPHATSPNAATATAATATASNSMVSGAPSGTSVRRGGTDNDNRLWMAQLQSTLAMQALADDDLVKQEGGVTAVMGGEDESLLQIAATVKYLRRATLAALSVCIDVLAADIRRSAGM